LGNPLARSSDRKSVLGRETWGHSMVIDPWGKVVAQLPQQGDLLLAEIDLALSDTIRRKMPVVKHSRFTHLLDNKD